LATSNVSRFGPGRLAPRLPQYSKERDEGRLSSDVHRRADSEVSVVEGQAVDRGRGRGKGQKGQRSSSNAGRATAPSRASTPPRTPRPFSCHRSACVFKLTRGGVGSCSTVEPGISTSRRHPGQDGFAITSCARPRPGWDAALQVRPNGAARGSPCGGLRRARFTYGLGGDEHNNPVPSILRNLRS